MFIKLTKRLKNKFFRKEYQQIQKLEKELQKWKKGSYEPGHYYSPEFVPSAISISEYDYFTKGNATIVGVEMNDESQFVLLNELRN